MWLHQNKRECLKSRVLHEMEVSIMLFNEFAEEIKRRVTEKLGIGFQIELI